MKIVTTMQDNEPVKVQRYEGDLLVGEKHIPVSNYCLSLMSQLPMGAHFSYLNGNLGQVKEYFSELEDPHEFSTFIKTIIDSAPYRWLKNDSSVLRLIDSALRVLPTVSTDTPEIIQFIGKLASSSEELKKLPLDTDLYKLFKHLMSIIIKSNDVTVKQDLADSVYMDMLRLLKDEQTNNVRELIEKIIPHLDSVWFNELVLDAQKRAGKPIRYYSGPVPKGVSYMSVTSSGTSYVYDIPAQQFETTYQSQKLGKIGYPRLLFIYKLNEKGVVSSMKLFAAKSNDPLCDDTTLYEYPYSHVFSGGKVCWNFSDITVEMLPYAAELFLSANNSNHNRPGVIELFQANKERNFDEDKLKPIFKLKAVLY